MKNKKRGKLNRWLLACMMIVLALALCGCRTRLTNNTSVSDSIVDEDGWMMEDYQYRRDEIGSPVAKKPFITGGGDEENEYEGEIYGEYEGEVIDDEEDEEDEDDDDIETDTVSTSTGTSSTSSTSSTTTTRRSSTTTRKTTSTTKKSSTTTKKTTTTKVTVTFNANGGKIASGSSLVKTSSKSYEVGASIGSFPSAVWDGHELLGWYSAASGGTKIETTTKVSEKITLYAQWDPPTEKKEYTIAWNLNGATTEDAMPTKGSVLPKPLPVVKKKGYHFKGWVDENGNKVSEGQAITADMKLKADLESWEVIWNERAKDAADTYIADGVPDDFVRGKKPEDEVIPDYVIICVSNDDFANDVQNNAKVLEEKAKYPQETTIIVIPKAATEGDNATYYKMLLLDLMYGDDENHIFSEDEFSSAYKDTEATIDINKFTPYKVQGTKAAENPGEGEDKPGGDNADNPDGDNADKPGTGNNETNSGGNENGGSGEDTVKDEQPDQ